MDSKSYARANTVLPRVKFLLDVPGRQGGGGRDGSHRYRLPAHHRQRDPVRAHPGQEPGLHRRAAERAAADRSEEHTSELQSLMRISYAVFCLKKKKEHA